MADKHDKHTAESFEVWFAEPDTGTERHQKADNHDQAVDIATALSWEGMHDVTVQKVTTVSTIVNVNIPAKPENLETAT